jgi:hypothetical protein
MVYRNNLKSIHLSNIKRNAHLRSSGKKLRQADFSQTQSFQSKYSKSKERSLSGKKKGKDKKSIRRSSIQEKCFKLHSKFCSKSKSKKHFNDSSASRRILSNKSHFEITGDTSMKPPLQHPKNYYEKKKSKKKKDDFVLKLKRKKKFSGSK